MVDDNPFLNQKFIKDIKRSFVPSKLFIDDKYRYNIIDVNIKLKKNNIIEIYLKTRDGKKYEYTYIPIDKNVKNISDKNGIHNNYDMIIDDN